jgi:hypothetical protein
VRFRRRATESKVMKGQMTLQWMTTTAAQDIQDF